MPSRKPTAKQDDNPAELIIAYLKAQNRPYSAIDVSSNLHNKVTKAKAAKILEELRTQGLITGAPIGTDTKPEKPKVFWALQDPADAATPEELAAFDTTIVSLRESIPALKATHKAKVTQLNQINSTMTTECLRDAVESLDGKKKELEARLAILRKGEVKPITKEERSKMEDRYRYWGMKSATRKRVWLEFKGMLEEGGIGREELSDKLGIDEDP